MNVNGWTVANEQLRQRILLSTDADIISINETHLAGDSEITLRGYIWYGLNRPTRHCRAPITHGGVGIFVRSLLFDCYSVSVVDKSLDGLLGIKLVHKGSDFEMIIYTVYLPPEGSNWGRDAQVVYNHLLRETYENAHLDSIIVCGDLNSRIADKEDFLMGIDDIPARKSMDEVSNQHGISLLEFLLESKTCILNGRVTPELDDFTCVSTRGRSVVDYFIVPHNFLQYCVSCKVSLSNDVIEANDLLYLIGRKSRAPDHSLLELVIDVDISRLLRAEISNASPSDVHAKKNFNRKLIPRNFMSSENELQALSDVNNAFEMCRDQQCEVDRVYMQLTDLLFSKMKELDPQFDRPFKTKNGQRPRKPFWNDELTSLWREMRIKERAYLKSKPSRERVLNRIAFKSAQDIFDKRYRFFERAFKKKEMFEIENIRSNDPKVFWDQLKKLGPRREQAIPLEVYNAEGDIVTDPRKVLEQWQSEFQKLYAATSNEQVDDVHQRLIMTENHFHDPLYEEPLDSSLNLPFTLTEIERVVIEAKNNKATGMDLIPYELLKFPAVISTLRELFQLLFDYHMTPSDWCGSLIHPLLKSRANDARIPMNYRGISLINTLAKLYSAALNRRVSVYLESNSLLPDEQCGFRPGRGCDDQLFVLNSVIQSRNQHDLGTFAAFIDLRKAFDAVNRDMLLYRLSQLGIGGNCYFAIKALYCNTWAQVRVNHMCTDPFPTPSGVRQGDTLSPTLFIAFMSDLSRELNESPHAVTMGALRLNHLLYADNIVLLAESLLPSEPP